MAGGNHRDDLCPGPRRPKSSDELELHRRCRANAQDDDVDVPLRERNQQLRMIDKWSDRLHIGLCRDQISQKLPHETAAFCDCHSDSHSTPPNEEAGHRCSPVCHRFSAKRISLSFFQSKDVPASTHGSWVLQVPGLCYHWSRHLVCNRCTMRYTRG